MFGGGKYFRKFISLLKVIIFKEIKFRGIEIGDWFIGQESQIKGALIFRDLASAWKGEDKRYAMFSGKYVNL